MLDILGNVFGRKKDKNSQPSTPGSPSSTRSAATSSFEDSSANAAQGSVIYPTILTDAMLRPPTSESSSNETTSSSTLPFSSSNQHRESITSTLSKTGTWNSHANHKSDTLINSKNSMNHYSSQGSIFANQSTHITNPLDNVPFVPNPTFDSVRNGFRGSSSSLASGSGDPLTRSFMAVERIGQFLATPSSSEYQFSEERRQLKESRASNGWTLLD